jgi:ABC-2 type transport system ATP-binding protein
MDHAIEVNDLDYRAGAEFSLNEVTLRVPTGSIYGFLGQNGSGKTTTIRILLGQLRAKHGSIRVLGKVMPRDARGALERIGYVPERPHLYPMLTVDEVRRYHAAFYPTWDDKLAHDLQARFGLAAIARLSRLSKGELGRLMMLLALSQRPELLILDEPTDGLDPAARRDVLSALVEFVAQRTATVFISSHLVHELERICDRVAILDAGRIVMESPMEVLKAGLKRIFVSGSAQSLESAPFTVVARDEVAAGTERWVVQGWLPEHAEWLTASGLSLHNVIDLDLEEGFVELLRARATPARRQATGSLIGAR